MTFKLNFQKSTTTMLIMVCLVAVLCCMGTVSHAEERDAGVVRMEVDPTVLPLVQPPLIPGDDEDVETEVVIPDTADVEAPPESVVEPVATPQPEQPTVEPAAPLAGKGAISSITADATDREMVITVVADRPVGDTSYMNLDGPKRLVIDLRQSWDVHLDSVIRLSDGAAKHVVIGEHPDRLRLVVHFRTPPSGQMTPRFVRDGNTLIISIVIP